MLLLLVGIMPIMIMTYEELHDRRLTSKKMFKVKNPHKKMYESTLKQVARLPLAMFIIYKGLLENPKNLTKRLFSLVNPEEIHRSLSTTND